MFDDVAAEREETPSWPRVSRALRIMTGSRMRHRNGADGAKVLVFDIPPGASPLAPEPSANSAAVGVDREDRVHDFDDAVYFSISCSTDPGGLCQIRMLERRCHAINLRAGELEALGHATPRGNGGADLARYVSGIVQ